MTGKARVGPAEISRIKYGRGAMNAIGLMTRSRIGKLATVRHLKHIARPVDAGAFGHVETVSTQHGDNFVAVALKNQAHLRMGRSPGHETAESARNRRCTEFEHRRYRPSELSVPVFDWISAL